MATASIRPPYAITPEIPHHDARSVPSWNAGGPDQIPALTVNLLAGPGAGKSTFSLGLASALKRSGVNCELVTEVAKDAVMAGNRPALDDQWYLTGVQHQREHVLRYAVDVIVTDSPLILGAIYNRDPDQTRRSAYEAFLVADHRSRSADTMNLLLNRDVDYQNSGRLESAQEAIAVDRRIVDLLQRYELPYQQIAKNEEPLVASAVIAAIARRRQATATTVQA